MKIHSHNAVNAPQPISPVHAPAKRNDPREVAFGAGVATPTGKPTDEPGGSGHARLDAFVEKLENRFNSALKSSDLSPRQQQALENERDRFHSMIARFEAAYLDGAESAKMDKAEGLSKLLEKFSKSVNHIVSGGDVQAPKDSPRMIDPAPVADGASRARGGIDTLG